MDNRENRQDVFEIFEEICAKEEQSGSLRQEGRGTMPTPLDEDQFYEIEYDSAPFPGVGKFVMKSSKIQAPPRDGIREKFDRMRDIARENRILYFNSSKFYDKRVRQENAKIFYMQGEFMADFEDDYEKAQPYSAYFPSYQTMGYEQLRTYFTWRTKVRQGNIEGTSLSYAFLYIYELINLIGVKDPEEGLERLLLFWDAYRQFDQSIDKYVPGWLKDYHIYYGLDEGFREFVQKNQLGEWYPDLADPQDGFDMLCAISKYDLRDSVFYGEGNEELVRSCFDSTMDRLERVFEERGMNLEELVFQPVKNRPEWLPFKGALFYPCLAQEDRTVVLSDKEVYFCCRDRWTFQTTLTTEGGKRLIGYVMKQMEAVLRKAVKYKRKLSANPGMLGPAMTQELELAGIRLEETVENAVTEFYRERNRTVVRVDAGALERIRQEALMTQEALIVPEEQVGLAGNAELEEKSGFGQNMHFEGGSAGDTAVASAEETEMVSDPWRDFGNALNETERKALTLALFWQDGEWHPGSGGAEGESGEGGDFCVELHSCQNMKQFADEQGVMLEVLMDGINEKAMDYVGDSLLDEEFNIYEDYVQQAEEMMEEIWRRR